MTGNGYTPGGGEAENFSAAAVAANRDAPDSGNAGGAASPQLGFIPGPKIHAGGFAAARGGRDE